MPKVKELRNILKKTGFIKASKINQAKKYPEQKVGILTVLSDERHINSTLNQDLDQKLYAI